MHDALYRHVDINSLQHHSHINATFFLFPPVRNVLESMYRTGIVRKNMNILHLPDMCMLYGYKMSHDAIADRLCVCMYADDLHVLIKLYHIFQFY